MFGGTFTPRLLPTLITIVMVAALAGLGNWQVERLHWKEGLIAAIHARTGRTPVDVMEIKNTGDVEYLPASATGEFQNDKEFYLVSISLTGEGGYHVLTPMKLTNGNFILIDRGWVPYEKRLSQTRSKGQLTGSAIVKGLLRTPQAAGWMQPANQPNDNQWYNVDLAAMAKIAGVPAFLSFYLAADATPNPGDLPIGGQTRVELPNNHLTYAITWYGLAFGLAVIYILSQWRRDP